jgi:hypothetical protein
MVILDFRECRSERPLPLPTPCSPPSWTIELPTPVEKSNGVIAPPLPGIFLGCVRRKRGWSPPFESSVYPGLSAIRHGRLVNFRTERMQHEFISTTLTPVERRRLTLVDND